MIIIIEKEGEEEYVITDLHSKPAIARSTDIQ